MTTSGTTGIGAGIIVGIIWVRHVLHFTICILGSLAISRGRFASVALVSLCGRQLSVIESGGGAATALVLRSTRIIARHAISLCVLLSLNVQSAWTVRPGITQTAGRRYKKVREISTTVKTIVMIKQNINGVYVGWEDTMVNPPNFCCSLAKMMTISHDHEYPLPHNTPTPPSLVATTIRDSK
jgi:hypothetical protein